MRVAVTGRTGQVVSALVERGPLAGIDVLPVGRPDMDLADPSSVARALAAAEPDVIVSAAAYTAVDKAESEPELAHAINATGAGAVASAAARLGVPVVHLSTDYVFDGSKSSAYREDDPVHPLGVYGTSKLAGERAVAAATPDHAILRVAWIFSPFGANFVRTMLRLSETRDVVRIVADQQGGPTSALDIADAVLTVATRLRAGPVPELRGIFHLPPAGEANWASFAEAIFAGAGKRGRNPCAVEPITTADYPTPARRPANSRLAGERIAAIHGIALPDWRDSLETCLDRLLGPAP
ncbi:dTDP-4-dehydrorhamnose reductase [Ancylobacter sp. 6x-1]|uniref:dTDP-4-dehydrorhamnose reductase n=1 Tax=Ancylobacter crimeensis TaxID=2579147 RepID=A0ABT0DDH6_9HYPH|nr:dTDP-4-dehydrorhamnose reductase [Ancylobacter crimeensis]MCK0198006.1 dTDP-4-dehydrorhamnose reductase [Ancylobacter crimeensis]